MTLSCDDMYEHKCRRLTSILANCGVTGVSRHDNYHELYYTLYRNNHVLAEGSDRLAVLEEARECIYALHRLAGMSN